MFGKINFKDLFYAFLALVSCLGTYLALPWFQTLFNVSAETAQDVVPSPMIVAAASPTPFQLADTPTDAVLAPGGAWVEDGVQLVLLHENRDMSRDGYCTFSLEFTIMNNSDRVLMVAVAQTDFLLEDETGMQWAAVGINDDHSCPPQDAPRVRIDEIPPGDIWNNGGKGSWLVWFGGGDSPPLDSNLYVKVSNILSVDAHWRLAGN